MKFGFRLLSLGGFLICAGAMAFALYLQYGENQEPCPMCIFQRIAMIGCGVVFLLAALAGPRAWGRWVWSGLVILVATIGALIAARHVWLQSLPPDQVPACGPTLDYLLSMMPISKVVTTVLRGDASCAIINSQWLGLSLPMWTMIGFIGLIAYAAIMPVLAKPSDRMFK